MLKRNDFLEKRFVHNGEAINLVIAVIRQAWEDAFLPENTEFKEDRAYAIKLFEDTEGKWKRSFQLLTDASGLSASKLKEYYYKYKILRIRYGLKILPEDAFYHILEVLL